MGYVLTNFDTNYCCTFSEEELERIVKCIKADADGGDTLLNKIVSVRHSSRQTKTAKYRFEVDHVGYTEQYYIEVTADDNEPSVYGKNRNPITVSKVGYKDLRSAKSAMRNRKRADHEDYPNSSFKYRILRGTGECVYEEF